MESGKYYHIYNRGNNRENIFVEKENYRFFLRKFNQYVIPYVDGYIHYNPVRPGLCKDFSDWDFSSYNEIVNGVCGYFPLADVTNWLFRGKEDFIRFHEAYRALGA